MNIPIRSLEDFLEQIDQLAKEQSYTYAASPGAPAQQDGGQAS